MKDNKIYINPLNAKLNPICHLLELLGAHLILHVSRIRVKRDVKMLCKQVSLSIGAPQGNLEGIRLPGLFE